MFYKIWLLRELDIVKVLWISVDVEIINVKYEGEIFDKVY